MGVHVLRLVGEDLVGGIVRLIKFFRNEIQFSQFELRVANAGIEFHAFIEGTKGSRKVLACFRFEIGKTELVVDLRIIRGMFQCILKLDDGLRILFFGKVVVAFLPMGCFFCLHIPATARCGKDHT